ncbi:LolA-like protein [Streptoalloteichus hindustanus]|uniref:hypothetical protein n=1 Tax=Streptoalloteichus hindustanus TaxID=2017 RepID=UPI0011612C3E|nr:hypothetical protein [Streptoalloteichus hindustanus]
MAVADWLGAPPPDGDSALPAWALARMAATGAEDLTFRAVVRRSGAPDSVDLSGRFGGTAPGAGGVAEPGDESVEVTGFPGVAWRDALADPALAVLFDPVVLVRDIGSATARHGVVAGRPCVLLDVVPHPVWADPESAWCPPGARLTRLAVDTATGFLLSAELLADSGVVARYEITSLEAGSVTPEGEPLLSSGRWPALPPSAQDRPGWTLARMAATLLDSVSLRAEVEIRAETRELSFDGLPPVGSRRWTVGVTTPDGARRELTMGDDHAPDSAPFPVARLAELLTPARIVSHLTDVTVVGETVTASVRPMRTFPFSAWAPDESVHCEFTVDGATGVLRSAALHSARRRSGSGSILADYRLNAIEVI